MKTLSVLLFTVLGVIVAHAQNNYSSRIIGMKTIPIKSEEKGAFMREYSTSMGTFSFITSPLSVDSLHPMQAEEMQYTQNTFSTTDGGTATFLKYETSNTNTEQPIQKDKDIEISISPNPFSTSTNLRIANLNETTNNELRIYDLLGREVRTQLIPNHQSQFTVERANLQAGIYIYEVRNEGQIAGRGKLIIVNE